MKRGKSSGSPSSIHPMSTSNSKAFKSYQGDFFVTYQEKGGKIVSSFVQLRLANNTSTTTATPGYDVSGICADHSGFASITDGHVSYEGYGWWLQEKESSSVGGDVEREVHTQVFCRGRFDFATNAFVGSRITNGGSNGKFLVFKGSNVVSSAASSIGAADVIT